MPNKHSNHNNLMIRLCEEETILLYFLHLTLNNLDQKSWSTCRKCKYRQKHAQQPDQSHKAVRAQSSCTTGAFSRLQAPSAWLEKTTATTSQHSPNRPLPKEKPLWRINCSSRGSQRHKIHRQCPQSTPLWTAVSVKPLLEANAQLLTSGGWAQPRTSHLHLW